jgi:hypothetical protein
MIIEVDSKNIPTGAAVAIVARAIARMAEVFILID